MRIVTCRTWPVFVLSLASSVCGETWFVSPEALGLADGSSWGNATTLEAALGEDGAEFGDSVWVSEGEYLAPFVVRDGVRVVGGFAGNEAEEWEADPLEYVTTLTGRSRVPIMLMREAGPTTLVRGFQLVDGQGLVLQGGGALILEGGSPVIANCVFDGSTAPRAGAVRVAEGSTPSFLNCVFRANGNYSNQVPTLGGAIRVEKGHPLFFGCLFHDNRGRSGGAIALTSGLGGTSAVLINCTIVANLAFDDLGGGISDSAGKTVLRNCIVYGNRAPAAPSTAEIFVDFGYVADFQFSNIGGGYVGDGNIDVEPGFDRDGSFRLTANSPCRDRGRREFLPSDFADLDYDGDFDEPMPIDFWGNPRVHGREVDMGAFERGRQGSGPPPRARAKQRTRGVRR